MRRLGPGREEGFVVDAARAGNGGVEDRVRQSDAPALALHRRRRPSRLRDLGGGLLQQGQPNLQPVVRRQTLLDQGRKQYGALAKPFDDSDFRHHPALLQ
jgi:hypothetical protein